MDLISLTWDSIYWIGATLLNGWKFQQEPLLLDVQSLMEFLSIINFFY